MYVRMYLNFVVKTYTNVDVHLHVHAYVCTHTYGHTLVSYVCIYIYV